jgi:hypothetical protein
MHPDDMPPRDMQEMEERHKAMGEAILLIRKNRRKLTQEAAVTILQETLVRRGVPPLPARRAEDLVRNWLRPSSWPLLHPRAARREGWRFDWPWSKD